MLFQVSHYLLLDDCENLQILLEINHSMSVNSEIKRPACLLNSFLDLSLGMRLNWVLLLMLFQTSSSFPCDLLWKSFDIRVGFKSLPLDFANQVLQLESIFEENGVIKFHLLDNCDHLSLLLGSRHYHSYSLLNLWRLLDPFQPDHLKLNFALNHVRCRIVNFRSVLVIIFLHLFNKFGFWLSSLLCFWESFLIKIDQFEPNFGGSHHVNLLLLICRLNGLDILFLIADSKEGDSLVVKHLLLWFERLVAILIDDRSQFQKVIIVEKIAFILEERASFLQLFLEAFLIDCDSELDFVWILIFGRSCGTLWGLHIRGLFWLLYRFHWLRLDLHRCVIRIFRNVFLFGLLSFFLSLIQWLLVLKGSDSDWLRLVKFFALLKVQVHDDDQDDREAQVYVEHSVLGRWVLKSVHNLIKLNSSVWRSLLCIFFCNTF